MAINFVLTLCAWGLLERERGLFFLMLCVNVN